jgi:hypothetical protein
MVQWLQTRSGFALAGLKKSPCRQIMVLIEVANGPKFVVLL